MAATRSSRNTRSANGRAFSGPNFKEGDRQAPEGFYNIRPHQMNPKSSYYLSFNMSFPNKFDRTRGRTGSNLMVHGACSSAGCYSMTDEQVLEIYAFAREALPRRSAGVSGSGLPVPDDRREYGGQS